MTDGYFLPYTSYLLQCPRQYSMIYVRILSIKDKNAHMLQSYAKTRKTAIMEVLDTAIKLVQKKNKKIIQATHFKFGVEPRRPNLALLFPKKINI